MSKPHQIKKYRVVITAKDVADHKRISQQLQGNSKAINDSIEKLFNQYFSDDQEVVIDKVALDLGAFNTENFLEEYKRRLIELLDREFKKLSKNRQLPVFRKLESDSADDRYKWLTHFLSRSYFPAHVEEAYDINELIEELWQKDERLLIETLKKARLQVVVQKRLKRQLKPQLYHQLEELLGHTSIQKNRVDELIQYFMSGKWPRSFRTYFQGEVEAALKKLNTSDRKKMMQRLAPKLNKKEIEDRIIKTLSIQFLESLFLLIPEYEQSIETFKRVRLIFAENELAHRYTYTYQYKKAFLAFMANSKQQKAQAKVIRDMLKESGVVLTKYAQRRLKSQLNDWDDDQSWLAVGKDNRQTFEKDREMAISYSQMDLFIRFLETGLFPSELTLADVVDGLLQSHAILLTQVLHEKWAHFPVRYRVAYQLDITQVIQIIHLLFGDSEHLSLFENLFDSDEFHAMDVPERIKRHLYFSFFEVMHQGTSETVNEAEFTAAFFHVFTQSVTQLQAKADEIITLLAQGQQHPGIALISLLKEESEQWYKSKGYYASIIPEILANGGNVNNKAEKKKKEVEKALLEAFQNHYFLPQLLLQYEVHPDFWRHILQVLNDRQRQQLVLQLAPFQRSVLEQVFKEIKRLQAELPSFPGDEKSIYPLSFDLVKGVLEKLVASDFSTSVTEIVHFIYGYIFTNLKKSLSNAKYRNASKVLQLLLKNPINRSYYYQHLAKWLENKGKEFIRGITPNDQKEELTSTENETAPVLETKSSQQPIKRKRLEGIALEHSSEYEFSDLIQFYAVEGHIPKWASISELTQLKSLLRENIKQRPALVTSVFKEIYQDRPAFIRLVNLIRSADLVVMLGQVNSQRLAVFELVFETLIAFGKSAHNLSFKSSEAAFKRNIYLSLLEVLLMQERTLFQYTVKQLLVVFAQYFSHQYGKQGSVFWHELSHYYPQIGPHILKEAIDEQLVMNKGGQLREWLKEGVETDRQAEFTSEELIIYYLKTQTFPVWSTFRGVSSIKKLISRGIELSMHKILDVLLFIKDDDQALITFTQLVGDEELKAILKAVDAQKFKVYRLVVADLLLLKELPVFLQTTKTHLETYLNEQITAALVKSTSLQGHQVATQLINNIAAHYALGIQEIYYFLNERVHKLKSKPLIKALKAFKGNQPVTVQQEDKLEESDNAVDVNALFYILEYNEFPWWYQHPEKKGSSIEKEKARLYKTIFQRDIPSLIESLRTSGKEQAFVQKIIKEVTLNEYLSLITAMAPEIAGFIVMYVRVLQLSAREYYGRLAFPSAHSVYLYMYNYVKTNKRSFTAQAFTSQMSMFVTDAFNINHRQFLERMEHIAHEMALKGESKFDTLIEVLTSVPSLSKGLKTSPSLINGEDSEAEQLTFFDVLVFYLTKAALPFNTEIKTYQELQDIFKAEAETNGPELRASLQSFKQPLAVDKLLKHGNTLLIQIAAFIYQIPKVRLAEWLTGVVDFMRYSHPEISKGNYEALAIKVLIASLKTGAQLQFNSERLIHAFFEEVKLRLIPGWKEEVQEHIKDYKPSPQVSTLFKRSLKKTVALPKKPSKTTKEEDKKDIPETPLKGSLEVHNAGAVILANFLPRYFDMLQMKEKRVFKDEETAARAVLLVQYLITGEQETPEHELVLNKVLCGVDLAYPVDRFIELTDKEKDISESLLKGVLQNWDRMQNVSVDALREGFLMRTGYLVETPYNWELEVEESGKDILLDFMPWSFNTIKLSWMKKSLNVKWRN
ncbi:hypothetical protein LVD15_02900 [Fulvivirga maritima]|uniref:contractile injection system tape measure protein n=1 Tax=Fulvivirga maritima TaxID=2904247 RepID=UPI001EEF39DD|nr:contractile injection system tape measure protein [Fulvivirga maritima]UII27396.1 hypothetical protein LVD15_02900 [Fulvivirga maritima]